jgi:hypothetical protein
LKGTGLIEGETVAIEYRLMTSLARPGATRTCPKRCGIRSQVEVLDASTSREIEGAFATAFFLRTAQQRFLGGDPLFGRRQMI